jgi:hypothetical protein
MNDRHRPLPLQDVFDIVERRRRQRARVRAVAGPAATVAAAGMAGVLVLVLQAAPDQTAPAAGPPAPPAALAVPSTGPTTTAAAAPPFDPRDLRPDFLPDLADGIFDFPSEDDRARISEQTTAIEGAWDLPFYPEAKAIAVKAQQTGTPLIVDSPRGADVLVSGFERAGYTDADAAELAAAWGTDERTAKIVGVLVAQAR